MTPDEHTNQEFFLDVGDGHQLYVQDWGNKDAKTPILFLHGGPGSGVKDRYKARFDPDLHRVIFFDQRGAGKSLPYGSLQNNTTQHLVGDIKQIIERLDLSQVILYGGSWGSCLALVFAIEHPNLVASMLLQGIFTGTQDEIEWLSKGRFKTFFPDVWQNLQDGTPQEFSDDPFSYHEANITSGDQAKAHSSAYLIGNIEGALMTLDDRYYAPDPADYDPTFIKLETHYLSNNCFLTDNYIINNVGALTMPVWLVQGRYDMVCPPVAAWQLDQALPNSHLLWTVAGHGNDRGNYDIMRSLLLQMADD
jgi:proline iminopeptidase